MNDLERAKQILNAEGYTCVLCHGESVLTSTKRGVAPMVEWIESGVPVRGYSAADKVIGKAAAMLFVLAGVTSVYGEVMSRAAAEFLAQKGVQHSCGTVTDTIINRRGDGCCPMELLTKDMNDESEAYTAIRNKLVELRKEST